MSIMKGTNNLSYWSYVLKIFRTEITMKISSKGLIRASGQVLPMEIGHENDGNCPDCKQIDFDGSR